MKDKSLKKQNKKQLKIKKNGRPKITKAAVKDLLIDNFFWMMGAALYAAAIQIFAIPNSIAQSGVSGLAIIVHYLFQYPIGVTNFILNIPLIILAWIFVGWKFVSKTLWTTVICSVFLDLFDYILPSSFKYTDDALLAALFCGVVSGVGLSMVYVRGSTTGGTDITARLVRLKWPHISFGRVVLAADSVVVALAAIVFKNINSALYAVIVIFISTRVIDYIMYGTGNGKMLMVFTDKAMEISDEIISQSRRGVSIVPVQGGYTGEHKHMIICAMRSSEVSKTYKLIKKIDPEVFVIITEAGEILGKGFKIPEE